MLGRKDEARQIDALLELARSGSSGALTLVGDPGIGKTTLCRYAVEQAKGLLVLDGQAVETEAALPSAFLTSLVRPNPELLDVLPPDQREAFDPSRSLPLRAPADRYVAGPATLTLLCRAAERQPVLLVVDDAHWLDQVSSEALSFAFRRLHHDSFAAILTARTEDDGRLRLPGPRIHIRGLAVEPVRELAEQVSNLPVPPAVAERLYDETAGNPLALIEVVRTLDPAVLRGSRAPPPVLPPGRSMLPALEERVRSCSPSVRRALLVLAAAGAAPAEIVHDAFAALDIDSSVLDEAFGAGILGAGRGGTRFAHPLLRAAVVSSSPRSWERRVHEALARAWAGFGRIELQAWHLAQACEGPDEEVAQALEASARALTGRLGAAAAAAALEQAAALSPPGPARAHRLVAAARAVLLAGRLSDVDELLTTAIAAAEDPRVLADVERLRAQVEVVARSPRSGAQRLARSAERVGPNDPERAAHMLAEAAVAFLMDARPVEALEHVRDARRHADRAGSELGALLDGVELTALLSAGRAAEAAPILDRCRARALAGRASADSFVPSIVTPLLWSDQFDLARDLSERDVLECRAGNAPSMLPYHLGFRAELLYWTGPWDASRAAAAEGVALAEETGQLGLVAFLLVILARVEAGQGRAGDCLEHLDRATALRARFAVGERIDLMSASVRALLLVGLGRYDDAVAVASDLPAWCARRSIGDTTSAPFWPDLVEGLERTGRTSQAWTVLGAFAAEAARTGTAWSRAASLRCRAMLAEPPVQDDLFGQAMALLREVATPFEKARTELCWGERLLTRSPDTGMQLLRTARTAFERLGAQPWVDRAATLERRLDENVRPSPAALHRLTDQEALVALTVAEGLTNKEAARRLFLSPKTIEFHLGHVYRKLGVTTRTQLARLLARQL